MVASPLKEFPNEPLRRPVDAETRKTILTQRISLNPIGYPLLLRLIQISTKEYS